ncbi:helix-turn-helix domain-containing protein [Xinfangfangia pollutisoli]|uniref:helix-turn-helix domain-containing protein n=1 Tax=Xinfangfangia pollutisoli TaxID=2865960 RepID=UPI001CD20F7A|nr:helix-turn-helix transcriptional regulator [Xinfangfangia pollutisoli]
MPYRNILVKHQHGPPALDATPGSRDNRNMKELAKIRRARGLTQKQLAEMAGVDQGTISKLESADGYNYTADLIEKLVAALKVEPAELFGLSDLHQRVLDAIRAIEDPSRQAAALLVLESMAKKP